MFVGLQGALCVPMDASRSSNGPVGHLMNLIRVETVPFVAYSGRNSVMAVAIRGNIRVDRNWCQAPIIKSPDGRPGGANPR